MTSDLTALHELVRVLESGAREGEERVGFLTASFVCVKKVRHNYRWLILLITQQSGLLPVTLQTGGMQIGLITPPETAAAFTCHPVSCQFPSLYSTGLSHCSVDLLSFFPSARISKTLTRFRLRRDDVSPLHTDHGAESL